jgi:putative cardiolipin synthase
MLHNSENRSATAKRCCLIPGLLGACLSFLVIAFLVSGCATAPKAYPRNPSTAFTDYSATSLGQLFEAAAEQHPGESGFAIIRHGRQAFTDRVALTELAEKSLDLQYYIWERDETGPVSLSCCP